MEYTLKVHSVVPEDRPDGRFLVVSFDILGNGEPVDHRKLQFDPMTSSDEIRAELQKYLAVYRDDQRIGAESAKVEAENDHAHELHDELGGMDIK